MPYELSTICVTIALILFAFANLAILKSFKRPILILLGFLFSSYSFATFHLWEINEVFTNSDGTIQFIELSTTANGQEFLKGHDLVSTDSLSATQTFTFPANSPAPTANKKLLLATVGFEAAYGFMPDFVIPVNFLDPAGGSINLVGADILIFGALDTDGISSTDGSGVSGQIASPQNFVGEGLVETAISVDFDGGGYGGERDIEFEVPLDVIETLDTDMDGIGDNADSDNATLGRVYLMTNSASNNVTSLHIVNSSSNAQTFTGTLFNGDGDQLGNADTPLHVEIISPQGRLILTASELESLFFVGPWAGPAILEVRGTSSFDLMTKLTSPSGLISNTNCVRQNNVHNIGGLDAASFTYVRFINQGTAPIDNITGTLYDANGTVLGDAGTLLIESLNPKAAVWLNRNNLSALFSIDWNGEASLVVEADSDEDLRFLNLNFVNGETFFNFSCYESAN